MSKTETLRQLTAAANANRLANLVNQIETVHKSKNRSRQSHRKAARSPLLDP